jgi:hypothetical protein
MTFRLEKQEKFKRYVTSRKQAQPSDQYETPAWIREYLKESENLKEDELFDICPLRKDWRQGFNYDALKENWSNKVNYGNPPFS